MIVFACRITIILSFCLRFQIIIYSGDDGPNKTTQMKWNEQKKSVSELHNNKVHWKQQEKATTSENKKSTNERMKKNSPWKQKKFRWWRDIFVL